MKINIIVLASILMANCAFSQTLVNDGYQARTNGSQIGAQLIGNGGSWSTNTGPGYLQLNGSKVYDDGNYLHFANGAQRLNIHSGDTYSPVSIKIDAAGSTFFNGGNVGIGITTPVSLLTLRNSSLADNASSGSVDLTFATTLDGIGNKISTYKETPNTAGLAFYTQYGWTTPFERMRITSTGNVGIGTQNPDFKLTVNGKIKAEEIQVVVDVADYVFEEGYNLKSIGELKDFINKKTNTCPIYQAEKK